MHVYGVNTLMLDCQVKEAQIFLIFLQIALKGIAAGNIKYSIFLNKIFQAIQSLIKNFNRKREDVNYLFFNFGNFVTGLRRTAASFVCLISDGKHEK